MDWIFEYVVHVLRVDYSVNVALYVLKGVMETRSKCGVDLHEESKIALP